MVDLGSIEIVFGRGYSLKDVRVGRFRTARPEGDEVG